MLLTAKAPMLTQLQDQPISIRHSDSVANITREKRNESFENQLFSSGIIYTWSSNFLVMKYHADAGIFLLTV